MRKTILFLTAMMLVALPAFAKHHKDPSDDPSCPSHTGMPTLAFGTNYGQCGTTANGATVVNGDDCGFRVTLGSDYNASETTSCTTQPCGCVMSFTSAFTQVPVCNVDNETDGFAPHALPTTTSVDIDFLHTLGEPVTLAVECQPAPN